MKRTSNGSNKLTTRNWRKEFEGKVIELYEAVSILQITPNQARKEFMKLLNILIQAVIKDVAGGVERKYVMKKMWVEPYTTITGKVKGFWVRKKFRINKYKNYRQEVLEKGGSWIK